MRRGGFLAHGSETQNLVNGVVHDAVAHVEAAACLQYGRGGADLLRRPEVLA